MSRQIMVVLSNDNGFVRLNRDINELIFKITMLDKDNKLSPSKTLISFLFQTQNSEEDFDFIQSQTQGQGQ